MVFLWFYQSIHLVASKMRPKWRRHGAKGHLALGHEAVQGVFSRSGATPKRPCGAQLFS